jgi:tellurite resistance protein
VTTPGPAPIRVTANLFGIAFGIVGLGGCWRVASEVVGAPGWIGDALAVVSAITWVAVGAGWAAQIVRGGRTLDGELHDPVLGPFLSLAPIVGMLLALALFPHAQQVGRIGFGVFAVATLLIGGLLTGQWIADRLDFAALHPGYFLPTVAGGFIGAQGAAEVGWPGPARALFGVGVLCWLLLGSLILARLVVGPPLPAALSPTLAIEVAPPAVGGNAYLALSGGRFDTVTWILAGYAILMVLVQLRLLGLYRRSPFGPGFWSFTFSFAAAATLALHWISHEHPRGATAWGWTVLGLITVLVAAIAAGTAVRLLEGRFLPRAVAEPAGPAS